MWTADEIAQLCYAHYGRLPKQGKPEPNREWTLLAAVVKIQPAANQTRDTPDKEVQGETLSPCRWDENYVRCFPILSTRWRSASGGDKPPQRELQSRLAPPVGIL